MKPRTKLQREVIESSKSLKTINEDLKPWAIKECTEHLGFATKNRVICMDCGNKFPTTLIARKSATCPHCDTKLQIKVTNKRKNSQHIYFAKAEVYGEFQVIRNFEIYAYFKSGEKARYHVYEIHQHWILPNGKHEVVSRIHNLNWCNDSWSGDMEIRKMYRPYWSNLGYDKYDVYPFKYHPKSKFKPEYTKYGIDHKLQGLSFLVASRLLPLNSKAETLLKARRYDLFSECSGSKISKFWSAVKICLRNNYRMRDVTMYLDYLDLLDFFGKDLRNAHYVCPKNLKREHDLYVLKKEKFDQLQMAEQKRIKQLTDERKFKELKSKFFGIAFSKGNIEVRVLESVAEYLEESSVMKHCVFSSEYYLKPDSLILSASVDGKKMETVEFDLNTFSVRQSRGIQNKNTEHHDDIVQLVNSKAKLIQDRITPPSRKRKQITKSHAAA